MTPSLSLRLLCAIGVLLAIPREFARRIRNTVLVCLVSVQNEGGNYNIISAEQMREEFRIDPKIKLAQ